MLLTIECKDILTNTTLHLRQRHPKPPVFERPSVHLGERSKNSFSDDDTYV